MKSKHLLLLLLMAFFAPWAANAQTLNEGFESTTFPPSDWSAIHVSGSNYWQRYTSSYHTGNASAYAHWASSGHENYLITPQLAPATDEALTFYVAAQSYSGTTLKVELSTTTPTAAAFTTTLATYTTGSNSSNYIGTTSTSTWVEKTIPATVLASYVGQKIYIAFHVIDSNGGDVLIDDVTGVSIYVPACPKPTLSEEVTTTINSATITWEPSGSNQTLFDIYWSETNTSPTDATTPSEANQSGTSFTINGLDDATTYYVWLRGNCGTASDPDVSGGWTSAVSFTTKCNPVTTFPWSEDFESYSASSSGVKFEDPCWQNIHLEGNGTYFFEVYSGANGTNNTKQLRLRDMSSGTMTKLRLPEMTLTTGDSYLFSIDVYRNNSTSNYEEGIRVYASTDGEIEGATELAFISRSYVTSDGNLIPVESGSGWYTYELPIPFTGTCYIVLRGESKYGSSTYMDNFKVKKELPCVKPSDPTFVSSTTTAATLSWTNGAEGQTAWQIAYSTNPNFNPDEVTPVDVTSNPGTITGLTAGSTYYAYVRANCGDLGYSEWTVTYCQFATECEAISTFPWMENFEGMTDNTVPMCWDNSASTSSDITDNPHYLWGVYSLSGNKVIRMYNFYAHTGTAVINSPTITLPAEGTYELTFDYAHNASCGAFQVKISEDGGTTFTEKGSYASTSGTTLTEATPISLAEYAGKSIIVQFFANANYGQGAIYVDNIGIHVPPTCIKPSALKCDSKTAHTATLSWTNGEEGQNAWQIAYSTTSDFNPDEVTPVDVTTNPATIEGLSQSTTYYAYVRANCGNEDGVSAWCNNKLTFTTLAGNVTPTGLAVAPASITSSQATASWNAVAGNTLHESYDIYWAPSPIISVPEEPAAPNLISGITATSQLITGLDPETQYLVWVRDNCGTDGLSAWSTAVTFTTAASCQTPDGLAESNVTSTSATITWNTYGLTDFNLRYSTDGTTWTTVPNVNSPYTFDNTLSANKAYQVQVQATCADAETWSNVLNFRTECAPMTITETDYINEGFEDYTGTSYNVAGVVPYCWDNYTTGTYPAPHVVTNSGYASYAYVHTGTNSLNFEGSANSSSYAALPEFTNDFSTLMVNFWMQTESDSNGKLSLGYITVEDNNYNTYQVIEEYDNTTTMTERTTYLGLKNVPATAVRLVFRWIYTGSSSYYACCIDDVVVKLGPSCYPVENLTYSDVLATTVKLSWDLVDDTQEAWQVCLNGDESNLIAATTHENFLLENLTPETPYTVKVRANCGDSQGEWSNEVSFTTLEACPAPSGLAASNLTQNTADLTWNGESDSYNVQYRTTAGATTNQLLFEGFETYADEAALEAVWTVLDLGDGENTAELGLYDGAKKTGDYGFRFSSYNGSSSGDFDQYLISPELTQAGLLEFAYKSSSGTADKFRVGYSSTTNEVSAFTWGDEIASASSWKTFSETMPENAKYFAINYTAVYKYRLYIDDITIYELNPAGAWQDATSTTTSTQLTGLTAGTEYEVQVQGVCNNVPGNWSEIFTFTTMAEGNKVFTNATTDGKWGTANNWMPAGAPALTDEVIIRANATIESTCLAKADKITFEGTPTPTLTIEDGGQLVHNSEGVQAIVKKNIAGYTTSTTNGGWYFISSPIMSSSSYNYGITPSAAGLITDNFGNNIPDGETATYDLYRFVESPGNDLEWKNYRNNSFNLDRTEGYLYANVNDVTLSFEGVIRRSDQIAEGGLDNTSGASFAGWNLMGNPFTCKAYSSLPYYVIDGSGSRLNMTAVLATTPIDVCTGVMVNANDGTLTSVKFSRTPQESANNGNVQMTLSQQVVNRDGSSAGLMTIDNAIVSFNESDQLEKFVFNSSLAKLYIPQYDKDYAIVASEGQGTLPVNFKATENGTYTLNVNVEGVEMSYLHLIDNMTGADVDLLANPSYSFDALTTDYESRFKLVFATGNAADDNFAFYSNGNWIINNDGEATLQVIDVTGRILSSETVAGSVSKAIHAAPGVYMLRLVNGNNVKVQKVVVR